MYNKSQLKKDIASTIAAAAAVSVAIMLLIKQSKNNKELKELNEKIRNSKELSKISDKISSVRKKIKEAEQEVFYTIDELDKCSKELEDLADYYGQKLLTTTSTSSSNSTVKYNEDKVDYNRSTSSSQTRVNPNFDPIKSKMYKVRKHEHDALVNKLQKQLNTLINACIEIDKYNKEFRRLAKTYTDDPKTLASINDKIDTLDKEVNSLVKGVGKMMKEKLKLPFLESFEDDDDYDSDYFTLMKESVIEGFLEGEFTAREAVKLLCECK